MINDRVERVHVPARNAFAPVIIFSDIQQVLVLMATNEMRPLCRGVLEH